MVQLNYAMLPSLVVLYVYLISRTRLPELCTGFEIGKVILLFCQVSTSNVAWNIASFIRPHRLGIYFNYKIDTQHICIASV